VRHILVRRRALAESVYDRLENGASFAALARRYSLDPGSRTNGGRLTVAKGQTVRPFDRVAFSLKTGAISRPFRTQYGWHIVQALSRIRPAHRVPFAKVEPQLRVLLLQVKNAAAMTAWVAAVKQEYAGKVFYAPGFAPGE
jgi:parvulin-like peptidyl-prolyl isomerase